MSNGGSTGKASALFRVVGWFCLALGSAASAILIGDRLFDIAPPGCGPESACAKLSRGPWSVVGPWKIPLSFVGLAYFLASATIWLRSRGGVSRAAWVWSLAGLAISVVLASTMVAQRSVCLWCMTVHAANAGWFACVWLRAADATRASRSAAAEGRRQQKRLTKEPAVTQGRWARWGLVDAATALGVVVACIALLMPLEHRRSARYVARAAQESKESQERIITAPAETRVIFTGRYLRGPERAAVRLVVFSDFQCVDCNRVEDELRALLTARPDVSLSMKHFPMSSVCNHYLERDMHPNACWAARAAVAAGILGGSEGFWTMHDWLFDRGGGFTAAELNAGVAAAGFDVRAFNRLMGSDDTLNPVLEDIEEAVALGIFFTPMIFINGVEFKGWQSPGALTKAVESVAAKGLPAQSAAEAHDVPLDGDAKFIADWLERPVAVAPVDNHPHSLGAPEAPIHVIVWGDVRVETMRQVDAEIRRWIAEGDQVRYELRLFPVDRSCNPAVSMSRGADSCLAAQALEAAARLGGDDAFWKMQQWMLSRIDASLTVDDLRAAAAESGVDAAALAEALDDPEVDAAIREDCLAGRGLGLRSVPSVWINGRTVPRISIGDEFKLSLVREHLKGG